MTDKPKRQGLSIHLSTALLGLLALGGLLWVSKGVPRIFWLVSVVLSLALLFGIACLSEYVIRRRTVDAPMPTSDKPKPKPRWFQFHLSTAFILMLVAGVLIGAERWYWRRHVLRVTPELERIETADPIADAEAAYAKKDYRFLGIGGEGERFPGICKGLKGKYEYSRIKGTGCCGPEPWQDLATVYAEAYNHWLSAKLLTEEAIAKP